ncbi:MAG TPA: hypothetical protein VL961_03690 [Acidimicrobiales bacterium]|nr:hypothetical protein [Acidimicrobiales bacterium]
MQGHVPGPPQPHFPLGLAPFIGYQATREPSPLSEMDAQEPDWLDEDVYAEEWGARHHPPMVRVMAVLVSISLVIAGLGTVFELLLNPH